MDNSLLTLIKSFFLFFLISLVVSISKNESILSVCPIEYKNIVRVSSYTSTIINNAVSILLLYAIVSIAWYVSILLEFKLEKEYFIDASKDLLIVFCFGELFKFGLIWTILNGEIEFLNFDESNFEEKLAQTYFFELSNYANQFVPLVATLFFAYKLIEYNVKLKTVFSTSFVILILLYLNIKL